MLTLSEEDTGRCASRETDAECIVFLRYFVGGAPTIFSRMSCDGFPTIVSSQETPTGVEEVVKGRTTVVIFFDLSSSLKEKHLSSRTGEGQGKEELETRVKITYDLSNSNIVGT
jgi:hypothetical protein